MTSAADVEDKYVHLEEVLGDDALDWVRGENARTLQGRKIEETEGYKSMLSILDSKEKIPYVRKVTVGGVEYLHNFWKDDEHVRGIWRRTSYEEYKKADPEWELLLDVDALGKKGGDSVNFYFAPENTPESTPESTSQSTPESSAKNGPFQYCQHYPDSDNRYLAQRYTIK